MPRAADCSMLGSKPDSVLQIGWRLDEHPETEARCVCSLHFDIVHQWIPGVQMGFDIQPLDCIVICLKRNETCCLTFIIIISKKEYAESLTKNQKHHLTQKSWAMNQMCLGPKTKQGYLKRRGFCLRRPTHASVTFARYVMLITDAVALCGTYRYL